MIAIIMLVLNLILMGRVNADVAIVTIPAKPELPPYVEDNDAEWDDYQWDAYEEYAAEFTALFNSYETKRARNGALMIRKGNSGSYRFAKKG